MSLKQRIRRDTRRLAGDPEATALLECLVEHLFDPNLDATFLTKVCGATREQRERLAAVVGPLKGFITELRMIEARRLVCDTDLRIAEIAQRLGYPVERTFRRVFQETYGRQPSAMRKEARARAETAAAPDPGAAAAKALEQLDDDPGLTPGAETRRLRRRSALGLLDPERAGELRARLRRRHPELEQAPAIEDPQDSRPATPEPPDDPVILGAVNPRLETVAAAAVFSRILQLPEADLRDAMLDGVWMGTHSAFDVLQQVCYHHAKFDPERAVAAAELGVQLLESHREMLGEGGDGYKALAWAFLAQVHMLAGDFGTADRVLDFAWDELAGRPMAPWAEIEVRHAEGLIRIHQGRDGEAARALDRAVELSRGLDRGDPEHIQTLLVRLELASRTGDAGAALPLCDELEELCAAVVLGERDPRIVHWRADACYHRARAHVAAGDEEEAEKSLERASEIIAAAGGAAEALPALAVLGSLVLHELARLEGRRGRLDGYESFLRRVRDRYRRQRTPVLEATAEAELAMLAAIAGRATEARELATSAADFLDDLPGHRRAWNAARMLRVLERGGAEAPPEEIARALAALRDDLDAVRWEITGAQATEAAKTRYAGEHGP